MALTSKQRAKIAARAYKLHQQRGGVEGHALDDWLTAEADVLEGSKRGVSPWVQVLIVPVLIAVVGAFVTILRDIGDKRLGEGSFGRL